MRELLERIEARQAAAGEGADRLRQQIAHLTDHPAAAEEVLERLQVTREALLEIAGTGDRASGPLPSAYHQILAASSSNPDLACSHTATDPPESADTLLRPEPDNGPSNARSGVQLEEFEPVAERVDGMKAVLPGHFVAESDGISVVGQPVRERTQPADLEAGMGPERGPEIQLHSEVDLKAGPLKPAAATGGERRRLGDLGQTEQFTPEGSALLLATGRDGELDMVDGSEGEGSGHGTGLQLVRSHGDYLDIKIHCAPPGAHRFRCGMSDPLQWRKALKCSQKPASLPQRAMRTVLRRTPVRAPSNGGVGYWNCPNACLIRRRAPRPSRSAPDSATPS
ncbi:hypothetical protein ACIRRH_31405 [Kitasatospora sp. NPDC101235]|uniref:hypothetical protein n=1 Tax=Kitasatospora sp. NPDC101235 TaxID=3364101 RepID=UPI003800166D